MTRQRSFKRLVRSRMEKTGESYTAARAVLLRADTPAEDGGTPWFATSDDRIRERTGRGWEEWFDLLDDWGAADMRHRDISRRVAAELGIDPLAWNAQAVTKSYERTRQGKLVGEQEDGFTINVSRTMTARPGAVFEAFTDETARSGWLPEAPLRFRTATAPRRAHFDWADDGSRVHVYLDEKGADRTTVTVQHARLSGAEVAEATKLAWRERLVALAAYAEGRATDA
jgi:activator of Hsp90 ATPase-like protein